MTALLEQAIERVRPTRRTLAGPYPSFCIPTEDAVVVVGIRHGDGDPATTAAAP
ncbi:MULTISPECIES: hypothetical protein [Methylobacterium]|uniref:hypothetical protein n=1 Tax=Methylobacterium TaxID=407 RepID=UPI0013EB9633|nr:hypothetical protein [Methylobacterium sp. DB0501]NGM34732.1 hypothetical protein [Methylobacterium sp. DB0501]